MTRTGLTIHLLACVAACSSTTTPTATTSTPNGWREDLHFVVDTIAHGHKNPFFHVAETEWRAEVARLDATLDKLDDAHAAVGLVHLVAMIGDSHTRLYFPNDRALPIVYMWLDDGVFVGGAAQHDAIGKRVVDLGGVPVDQALATLGPLVASENDAWRKSEVQGMMANPLALAGSGLSTSVTLADGATLALAPGKPIGLALPAKLPLHIDGPTNRNYWNKYIAADELLYVQYNACADDPREKPFATFAANTLEYADAHPVHTFVIDLRTNMGGNSAIIHPLIEGLARRPLLHVFVLIGRQTFSSGMLAAIEAKRTLHATLVGAPTGGDPNGYGEIKTFTLPHSHLTGQYSTKLFADATYRGTSVTPDIEVGMTSADWFGGRDPAMDAILAPADR